MCVKLSDVKVGDTVICYEISSHDYIEHRMKVLEINNDPEEGVILFGEDLEYESWEDNAINRVDASNYVRNAKL